MRHPHMCVRIRIFALFISVLPSKTVTWGEEENSNLTPQEKAIGPYGLLTIVKLNLRNDF